MLAEGFADGLTAAHVAEMPQNSTCTFGGPLQQESFLVRLFVGDASPAVSWIDAVFVSHVFFDVLDLAVRLKMPLEFEHPCTHETGAACCPASPALELFRLPPCLQKDGHHKDQ